MALREDLVVEIGRLRERFASSEAKAEVIEARVRVVMSEFFVVDLRPAWASELYVTLWRANDAGYAQSIPWAGLYSLDQIASGQRHYCKSEGRKIVRMAVPADVVRKLATQPIPERPVDGPGPVLHNTPAILKALKRARLVLDDVDAGETYPIGAQTSILSPAGRGLLHAIAVDRRKLRRRAVASA